MEFVAEIDRKVALSLDTLYARNAVAKTLAETAKGVLVFPDIVEGGLLIGGQFGHGALIKDGKTAGYYRSLAVSYGAPGRCADHRLCSVLHERRSPEPIWTMARWRRTTMVRKSPEPGELVSGP